MEKERTCCVTGHREIPSQWADEIGANLRREVLRAVGDGYRNFISGFAKGADLMFADIVAQLKGILPITLEAALPYPQRLRSPDRQVQRLLRCCDAVQVCSDHYFGGCFMRRNRHMVDRCRRVIAVYDGRESGGTAATLRYAKDCEVRIVWR